MKVKIERKILLEFVKFCLANKVKPGYFNHVDEIVRYGVYDKNGCVEIDKELVEWLCKWYDAFHLWKYSTCSKPKPKFYQIFRNIIK